jgi:hypothetical protein
MALDEPQNNDEVYTVNGFQYLIEKDFLEKAKPVKVDFMGMGFQITSSIELSGGGCSGCGTDQKSSSCGSA